MLVVTIMSHRYNSRTGSGKTKVERNASPKTQPNQAALLLINTARIQPRRQPHQCVGGNTVHLATWLACTMPGPPQESLVRDDIPTGQPSLTRTTLCQLYVAPPTSRSRPAATELGCESRVSGFIHNFCVVCMVSCRTCRSRWP